MLKVGNKVRVAKLSVGDYTRNTSVFPQMAALSGKIVTITDIDYDDVYRVSGGGDFWFAREWLTLIDGRVVAKLIGVPLDETFVTTNDTPDYCDQYKLTEQGLVCIDGREADGILTQLLNGELRVQKKKEVLGE